MPKVKKVTDTFDSNTRFPKSPNIRVTTDYEKFNFLKYNRNISKTNVDKIKQKSLERFEMHKFPIIVDKDYNIIDGQHRYTACKQLKCPVYYIVDSRSNIGWKDIHRVNVAGKKHDLNDKLQLMMASGESKELQKAFRFHKKYAPEGFKFQGTVRLLGHFEVSGNTQRSVDRGTYQAHHMDATQALYEFVNSHEIPKYPTAHYGLIFGIAKLIKKSDMNYEFVLNRLRNHQHRIHYRTRREDVYNEVRDAFNFKLSVKAGKILD